MKQTKWDCFGGMFISWVAMQVFTVAQGFSNEGVLFFLVLAWVVSAISFFYHVVLFFFVPWERPDNE